MESCRFVGEKRIRDERKGKKIRMIEAERRVSILKMALDLAMLRSIYLCSSCSRRAQRLLPAAMRIRGRSTEQLLGAFDQER